MRYPIQILLPFLITFIIVGCQNSDQKGRHIVQKEYGKWNLENDSLGVKLEISRFTEWSDLLKRTEEIVCNDSVPKIILKRDKELKTIYLQNPCWEGLACILIKERNTIKIHNDSVSKYGEQMYILDSLDNFLKRDFENNGKNPILSDSPDKLLIYVSYDNGFEKLPHTLDKLTTSFEKNYGKMDINIWLDEKLMIIPPPPPPIDL